MTEIEIKGEKYAIVKRTGEYFDYIMGLPNGYDFLFRYSTATESDFEKVVERMGHTVNMDIGMGSCFKRYNEGISTCLSARMSFKSLLIKHSIDPNADYIILKRKQRNEKL